MEPPMDPGMLRDWQARCRFNNRVAAARLGLSERAFRRQKRQGPVGRQTALLAGFVELLEPHWLDLAEVTMKLARMAERTR